MSFFPGAAGNMESSRGTEEDSEVSGEDRSQPFFKEKPVPQASEMWLR